ncbi:MAG: dodecin family protein, partial [Actinobacteria bacterium]|nr:dodecin family protein [Actinomycetota bacterium]
MLPRGRGRLAHRDRGRTLGRGREPPRAGARRPLTGEVPTGRTGAGAALPPPVPDGDGASLPPPQEHTMASVARITEISSRSEKSFEDAIRVAVDRAT